MAQISHQSERYNQIGADKIVHYTFIDTKNYYEEMPVGLKIVDNEKNGKSFVEC